MLSEPTLRALVVDDEAPARDDLAWQLERSPLVSEVGCAADAGEALRWLRGHECDAIFLDIHMPGLDGLELSRVLGRFDDPPSVVFVTAHSEHAVAAFGLRATDYLLKPVHPDRLNDALARIGEGPRPAGDGAGAPAGDAELDVVAVESPGVTRLISRDSVLYAEASGDYVRLHTAEDSHLVRVPISALQDRWRRYGFMRVHRRFLVALRHVREWHSQAGGAYTINVGLAEIPVARRQATQLRHAFLQSQSCR